MKFIQPGRVENLVKFTCKSFNINNYLCRFEKIGASLRELAQMDDIALANWS
jgi:hypothetical protein